MILVSGTSSGLGKYLRERLSAKAFRRDAPFADYERGSYEAIVHCAFNPLRDVRPDDLNQYFDDNTLLTRRLASLKHGKFVYLSTVDVYPRDGAIHDEKTNPPYGPQDSAYGLTKVLSERTVRQMCPNHLILRPTGLIGSAIRPTTLTRLLTEPNPALSLAATAILNFVPHEDIGDLIAAALKRDLTGTFNVAASANATLAEIASAVGATPRYGSFVYDIGRVDCGAARGIVPGLARTTLDNVTAFAAAYRAGSVRLPDPVCGDPGHPALAVVVDVDVVEIEPLRA